MAGALLNASLTREQFLWWKVGLCFLCLFIGMASPDAATDIVPEDVADSTSDPINNHDFPMADEDTDGKASPLVPSPGWSPTLPELLPELWSKPPTPSPSPSLISVARYGRPHGESNVPSPVRPHGGGAASEEHNEDPGAPSPTQGRIAHGIRQQVRYKERRAEKKVRQAIYKKKSEVVRKADKARSEMNHKARRAKRRYVRKRDETIEKVKEGKRKAKEKIVKREHEVVVKGERAQKKWERVKKSRLGLEARMKEAARKAREKIYKKKSEWRAKAERVKKRINEKKSKVVAKVRTKEERIKERVHKAEGREYRSENKKASRIRHKLHRTQKRAEDKARDVERRVQRKEYSEEAHMAHRIHHIRRKVQKATKPYVNYKRDAKIARTPPHRQGRRGHFHDPGYVKQRARYLLEQMSAEPDDIQDGSKEITSPAHGNALITKPLVVTALLQKQQSENRLHQQQYDNEQQAELLQRRAVAVDNLAAAKARLLGFQMKVVGGLQGHDPEKQEHLGVAQSYMRKQLEVLPNRC